MKTSGIDAAVWTARSTTAAAEGNIFGGRRTTLGALESTMGAIPGGIDTARGPPMTIPLRHFVAGLGFLLAGTALGAGTAAGAVSGLGGLAHVHVLLVGWVCVTIMGAMTQFVPVWSGARLYSRRLANAQLVLVAVGLVGFASALLAGRLDWLAPFGLAMLAGFWTFAYNVGRTLATVPEPDVTERHFALALGFFVGLTLLGVLLAASFATPTVSRVGLSRQGAVEAHVTLAVFGAVLTTIYGALYQLATMFTQTELHGVDHRLCALEEVAHPIGVVLLAGGRLVGGGAGASVARVGGLLVLAAALAVAVVLARKLVEMRVERTPRDSLRSSLVHCLTVFGSTPMHARYAVVAGALPLWALAALPAWLAAPTAHEHLFGAAGTVHLLVLGVVGFVVLGTLYHVVPFVVWVHRYSDDLGLEPVPMIDDLYDDRFAAIDGLALLAGTALLVAADLLALPSGVPALAGGLVGVGVLVFVANLLLVLVRHGSQPLDRVALGALSPRRDRSGVGETTSGE